MKVTLSVAGIAALGAVYAQGRFLGKNRVKNAKVEICHFTDEGDWHTISVSQNAVESHVQNHGDLIGECNGWCETLCNDTNACTIDAHDGDDCEANGCTPVEDRDPVNCDDNDACTNDGCDPLTGCTTTPVDCNDNDACTNDGCNSLTGCTTTPVDCDDGDACTNDGCNSLTGCTTTPVDCDDNDACTNNGCNPLTGCTSTPVDCDDGDLCTVDTCDSSTGCSSTPVDCSGGGSCDPATGECVVDDSPIVDVSNCDNCDAATANCQLLASGEYKCVCNIGFTDFGSGCVPTPNENCYNTPSSSRLWTASGNTCGVKSPTPNVLLFDEDFESYPNGQNLPASTGWVGKNAVDYANDNLSPYPRYSPIPNDPHGQALTFRRLNSAGDIFSLQTVACPSGKYCYLVFDYLTLCRSPNANNQRSGICFGYAQAYPGHHNWYCDASYNNILPTKAGSWVRCRMPWNFRSPYRVMLEDFSGVPEDIIYDNIRIIQTDTPQTNCCEVLDLNNYVDSLA
eukprot:CAMPEP_0203748004 /NCGR_PEP_ID=MMETSP0098-20131031/2995_1 /ASSEMBLY_ACC=CAM_ASM_000208 /TAXON_ID=96639 /ORGANISM=" , Strain NY0313808BC1" /LENGTH=510 /DNA_ID=CAMNT_0050636609 /DNA_START=422 /DNA_END=1951 /DNA_ORIENTATION=+